jgi:hypothetical protein
VFLFPVIAKVPKPCGEGYFVKRIGECEASVLKI